MTELTHRFEFVKGSTTIEEMRIVSVASKKHASVKLCIKSNMNIPFAEIRLFDRDRFVDAEATFESAAALGKEIERRFNGYAELEAQECKGMSLNLRLDNASLDKRIKEFEAKNKRLREALHDIACGNVVVDSGGQNQDGSWIRVSEPMNRSDMMCHARQALKQKGASDE